jgi:hypothetical protein
VLVGGRLVPKLSRCFQIGLSNESYQMDLIFGVRCRVKYKSVVRTTRGDYFVRDRYRAQINELISLGLAPSLLRDSGNANNCINNSTNQNIQNHAPTD